ncbi:MAG: hypothetical protein KDC04_08970, partial [Saprospiraceae bacterium]|nr:hypothetical protein [Saprospiraceae bacterium]
MKRRDLSIFIIATILVVFYSGCFYSLKGISIDPTVKTFVVQNFDLAVPNAPGDINQRFSELLRNKIRNQTRLTYNENTPDIEFSGSISSYTITPENPTGNNNSPFNKLEIGISVEYVDNNESSKSWKQKFTFFKIYDNTLD